MPTPRHASFGKTIRVLVIYCDQLETKGFQYTLPNVTQNLGNKYHITCAARSNSYYMSAFEELDKIKLLYPSASVKKKKKKTHRKAT